MARRLKCHRRMTPLKDFLVIVTIELLVASPGIAFFNSRPPAKSERALKTDMPKIARAIGYFASAPEDPWARPYRLEFHDGAVKIASLGKDGSIGGEGEDADLEVFVTASSSRAPGPGSNSPHPPPRECGRSTGSQR